MFFRSDAQIPFGATRASRPPISINCQQSKYDHHARGVANLTRADDVYAFARDGNEIVALEG